jgi:DNA invertase Pin-like site-specific DNA recombinase
MKRALLYARVSTADKGQDWKAQLEELRRVARQRGWKVVGNYYDAVSGAKASRPGLDLAVARCRAGEVDIFAAVSVDRVGRSVKNFLAFVDELVALGVQLACTREGQMDMTTPQGQAFMQMRAVFAELERKFIGQRIREALAVRRARGQRLGRQPTLDYSKLPQVLQLRRRRRPPSWTDISQRFGGSAGAWSRAVSRAS